MRDTGGRNAANATAMAETSRREGITLRLLELDVQSDPSVEAAISAVLGEAGRIDVVIHNAGHMMFGPAGAFLPEQLAQQYDVNVLGTQRVNRAVLPHMRARREGLLVWISSSSSAGGMPPWLAPYFAAKAAMDFLATLYARELSRWGIETTIAVPGTFTRRSNHFANAGSAADLDCLAAYEAGPYAGFGQTVQEAFGRIVPENADPAAMARMIVEVVAMAHGTRPFRIHCDPAKDGAAVGFAVLDRLRAEMLHRVGLSNLLSPGRG